MATIKNLATEIKKFNGNPEIATVKSNGVDYYYLKYNPENTDAYFAYASNRWKKLVSQSAYLLPGTDGAALIPEATEYRDFLIAAGVLGQQVSAYNNYDIGTLKKINNFDSALIPHGAEVKLTVDVGGEGRYDDKKYGGAIDINIRATSQILPKQNGKLPSIPHFVYGNAEGLDSFLPAKFADVVITEGVALQQMPALQTAWAKGLVRIVKPGGTIKLQAVNKEFADAVIQDVKTAYGSVSVTTEQALIQPFPPPGFKDIKETLYTITVPK